jgi:hypothetical protein
MLLARPASYAHYNNGQFSGGGLAFLVILFSSIIVVFGAGASTTNHIWFDMCSHVCMDSYKVLV